MVLLFQCLASWGQKFPERTFIRSGNSSYNKGDFSESETDYRRALEKSPASYEATYNLGNSLYKQERYEEAAQAYGSIIDDSSHLSGAASAAYNIGNSLFKQRQLEQALESYKRSLRINPNDQQTKFNLAYTKKLLDEQKKDKEKEKEDQDKEQNKDQNKDQKQEGKSDQNQDNKDQKQSDKPKDQPQQSSMSQQEAESMLEAMQMSEDKTREKVNQHKVKTAAPSGKNW